MPITEEDNFFRHPLSRDEKERQFEAKFIENIRLIIPKDYYDKQDIINEIEDCLEYNLEDESHFSKVLALFYFQRYYIELRKQALNDGKIFSADCSLMIILWIDRKVQEIQNEELNIFRRKLKAQKSLNRKSSKRNVIDLEFAWSKPKLHYDKVIKVLTQYDDTFKGSFVFNKSNKLYWNNRVKSGWVQYLAGFIYTCIQAGFIDRDYSAPDWQKMLQNTFNVKFNSKPFKNIWVNIPDKKYRQPFRKIKFIK